MLAEQLRFYRRISKRGERIHLSWRPLESGSRQELADNKVDECQKGKHYTEHNRSIVKCLFKSAARVETGAEVVSTKCASERGSRALQNDRSDEEYRNNNLHIGQHTLEKTHRDDCSTAGKRRQI